MNVIITKCSQFLYKIFKSFISSNYIAVTHTQKFLCMGSVWKPLY